VVLFYFRDNLNFYKKNATLKKLSYLWLIQNAFLSLSVIMRVYHYVQHYNLAHKRIGVIVFVALCLIGLFLIYRKVSLVRSSHFLVKYMSMSALCIITLYSLPNWDRIIAKYNFEHSDTAFVHLDFLSDLRDSALPFLVKSPEQLENIKQTQRKVFSSSMAGRHKYMTNEQFVLSTQIRASNFKDEYPSRHWLEWTYADWNAHKELSQVD
jgi:hypothetical protein